MKGDLFYFLGIFALIFVVWVVSGGPSRPISFAGPYLNPIHTTGTTAQPYGDPTKYSSINSNITVGLPGVSATGATSGSQGAVTLSHDTWGARNTDPKSEYVVINVSMGSKAISTAGWKLMSKTSGNSAAFPQGTETPRSGRINTLTPVTLHAGEQIIVTTGRSPVGVSFRENKCTGYLEEHQDFHPALSMNCPTPSQEFSRFYDDGDSTGTCASYVRSIPYCSTETKATGNISSSCERFVEQYLSYNSCLDAHQKDSDFNGFAWRLFLGKGDELWKKEGETITLLDADNKVIDSITY